MILKTVVSQRGTEGVEGPDKQLHLRKALENYHPQGEDKHLKGRLLPTNK